MAYTSRTIEADVAEVWLVLIDPTSYPSWLVGTKEIRKVDDEWPAVGSSFHHTVGIGAFVVPDRSEVLAIEPHRLLQLAVKARPFVSAVARFELVCDGERTVVSLEEEPSVRVVGNIVRPLLDPTTHVRNHRSLRRLDALVTDRRGSVGR